MKKFGFWVLLLTVATGSVMYAQEKKSKKELRKEQAEKVQNMVEAQDYRFVAQHALPMSMRSIHLTSEYDLCVGKDIISAYLPYFGRAYVAPMNPSEGGIKFESKDFNDRIENAKKGGWTVHITIRDAQRRIEMVLNISAGGSANLSVNDDTRQSISFNGYVTERKKR
jgi:hypothetical protein